MAVQQDADTEQRRAHVVEVVLVSGEKIKALLGVDEQAARAELAGLHGRLEDGRYLRVGDDTIVRAEEVRWLQLRPHDDNDGGLIDSLMTKVRGGDEMSNYETHHSQGNRGSGLSPWIGYGRRP